MNFSTLVLKVVRVQVEWWNYCETFALDFWLAQFCVIVFEWIFERVSAATPDWSTFVMNWSEQVWVLLREILKRKILKRKILKRKICRASTKHLPILSESEIRNRPVLVNLPILYFYTVFYESERIFVGVWFWESMIIGKMAPLWVRICCQQWKTNGPFSWTWSRSKPSSNCLLILKRIKTFLL